MRKTWRFLGRELSKALPPTLFFMVVFHVAALIHGLDERSFGITPSRSATATVGALILGKLFLLLDDRRVTQLFAGRPLIYTTLWKTLLYSLLATLALWCEELAPRLYRAAAPHEAWTQIVAAIDWPRFWATHINLVSWVLIFCILSALIEALGKDRAMTLFFGVRPRRDASRPDRR